jgi:hypothetical protein
MHLLGIHLLGGISWGHLLGAPLGGTSWGHLLGVHLLGVYLIGVHLLGAHLLGVDLTGVHLLGVHLLLPYTLSFAAENAESGLGISHRKNQYAITLQKGYIIAFYDYFCTYQLSQHDLAVHSAFPHSLQPVLTCVGRAFSLTFIDDDISEFMLSATRLSTIAQKNIINSKRRLKRWK